MTLVQLLLARTCTIIEYEPFVHRNPTFNYQKDGSYFSGMHGYLMVQFHVDIGVTLLILIQPNSNSCLILMACLIFDSNRFQSSRFSSLSIGLRKTSQSVIKPRAQIKNVGANGDYAMTDRVFLP